MGSLPADLLLLLGGEVEAPPYLQLPPDGLGRVVLVHGLPSFQLDPLHVELPLVNLVLNIYALDPLVYCFHDLSLIL